MHFGSARPACRLPPSALQSGRAFQGTSLHWERCPLLGADAEPQVAVSPQCWRRAAGWQGSQVEGLQGPLERPHHTVSRG